MLNEIIVLLNRMREWFDWMKPIPPCSIYQNSIYYSSVLYDYHIGGKVEDPIRTGGNLEAVVQTA